MFLFHMDPQYGAFLTRKLDITFLTTYIKRRANISSFIYLKLVEILGSPKTTLYYSYYWKK